MVERFFSDRVLRAFDIYLDEASIRAGLLSSRDVKEADN